jgi:hypothetical protein
MALVVVLLADLRIGFGRIKHASLTIVGEMGAGFRVADPVGVFS